MEIHLTFQMNQRQEAFHHCLECKIVGQTLRCSTSELEEPQKLCECKLFDSLPEAMLDPLVHSLCYGSWWSYLLTCLNLKTSF